MPITFRCPVCKHALLAPSGAAGYTSICPKCHTAVPVPLASDAAVVSLPVPVEKVEEGASLEATGGRPGAAPAHRLLLIEDGRPGQHTLHGGARHVAAGLWLVCGLVALVAVPAVLVLVRQGHELVGSVFGLFTVAAAYVFARAVERCMELFGR